MKLRHKETGQLIEVSISVIDDIVGIHPVETNQGKPITLDMLCDEFEEYNEDFPKEGETYYYISATGCIIENFYGRTVFDINAVESGNCFRTKEEAEKAVEKLKALKRLRDKGFKFEGIKEDYTRHPYNMEVCYRNGRKYLQFNKAEDDDWLKENWDDLKLLFNEDEE